MLIKVMIVDDHKILTDSLKFLLDKSDEIQVVGTCCKSEDSLQMYKELNPDVILMDIHFYDEKRRNFLMSGIEALKLIKEYDSNAKVLILTSETSKAYMEQAVQFTDGYIIKDCSIEELIDAIKCCNRGLKIFDPFIVTKVMNPDKSYTNPINDKKLQFSLSDKEIRIINLIAEGKTCKEIAVEFGSTEGYIRNILINIYDKLGIESHKSTALVAFAAKEGILG
jgi:DNA-binding NarL/FixJ family response regulator